MRIVGLLLLLTSLSSCFPIDTNTVYNKNWTGASSGSEPIYLSFQNSKSASYYFTLKHVANSNNYILTVRWNSKDSDLLFNGVKSTLKFFVNKRDIFSVQPIKIPKTIGYNLETKGHQEEAIFILNYDQISALANAKTVEVELTGRYIIVTSYFNKFHTFKAFRNFLQSAPS